MIGSWGKWKGKWEEEKFKNQDTKTKILWETQKSHNWSINSINQNMPRGPDTCGATTTH